MCCGGRFKHQKKTKVQKSVCLRSSTWRLAEDARASDPHASQQSHDVEVQVSPLTRCRTSPASPKTTEWEDFSQTEGHLQCARIGAGSGADCDSEVIRQGSRTSQTSEKEDFSMWATLALASWVHLLCDCVVLGWGGGCEAVPWPVRIEMKAEDDFPMTERRAPAHTQSFLNGRLAVGSGAQGSASCSSTLLWPLSHSHSAGVSRVPKLRGNPARRDQSCREQSLTVSAPAEQTNL